MLNAIYYLGVLKSLNCRIQSKAYVKHGGPDFFSIGQIEERLPDNILHGSIYTLKRFADFW